MTKEEYMQKSSLLLFLNNLLPFLGQRSKTSWSNYPRFCKTIVFNRRMGEVRTETEARIRLPRNTHATGKLKSFQQTVGESNRPGKS